MAEEPHQILTVDFDAATGEGATRVAATRVARARPGWRRPWPIWPTTWPAGTPAGPKWRCCELLPVARALAAEIERGDRGLH